MRRYGDLCIDLVATTKEKFSKIKVGKRFIFLDSFSHLSMKLDKLAQNLKDKSVDHFPLIREEYPEDDKFKACLQKLIYPYAWVDDFDKFDHKIPSPDKFFNDLTGEDIPSGEYERLLGTCKLFNITTVGQLHDLYLKIDVLILASVFEFYRDMGMQEYGLDPAYYISAPAFSFDAMLFKTGVELELFDDESMYTFVERGMRGWFIIWFTIFKDKNIK